MPNLVLSIHIILNVTQSSDTSAIYLPNSTTNSWNYFLPQKNSPSGNYSLYSVDDPKHKLLFKFEI